MLDISIHDGDGARHVLEGSLLLSDAHHVKRKHEAIGVEVEVGYLGLGILVLIGGEVVQPEDRTPLFAACFEGALVTGLFFSVVPNAAGAAPTGVGTVAQGCLGFAVATVLGLSLVP